MNRILSPILIPPILLSALALGAKRVSAASPSRHSAAHSSVKHVPRRHIRGIRSGTFPILSFAGTRVGGTVFVTAQGSRVSVSVSASGLVPFSIHAVHIHEGSCRSAYTGIHLYILGFIRASGAGRLAIQGAGPSPYIPNSDYVIVYASAAPSVIVGCANLGALR